MDSDFMDSEPEFDVLCNVVSILPAQYDVISKVEENEEEFDTKNMANHKPVCYYVMNNGCVEEQQAMFEKPNGSMQSLLKTLFMQAKVDNIGVNKVLVDGGCSELNATILIKKDREIRYRLKAS